MIEIYLMWLQAGVQFSAEWIEKMAEADKDKYTAFIAAANLYHQQKKIELKEAILDAITPDEITLRKIAAQNRYIELMRA